MKADLSNASSSTTASSLNYPRDDEGNLMELWCILIKRKGLILAILFLSLIAAGLLIHFTHPVYESRAVLQIGQIGQIEQSGQSGQSRQSGQGVQIESPIELAKRLMVQQVETTNGQIETGKARPFIETASTEKDTNLISITARGPDPDTTQKYLTQVVEEVVREHQKLLDYAQREQQQSLNLMQAGVKELDQAINGLDKQMRALVRQPTTAGATDAFLGIYLAPERSKLLEQRMQLEQKQRDLRMAMSELRTKPTVVIARPSLPGSPVKPRPSRYFVLAIGAGLLLGIASAFVVEFASKARNELKEMTQK